MMNLFLKKSALSKLALLTSFLYFFSNVAFAYKPQLSLWEERQKNREPQLASLPLKATPAPF